MSRSDLRAHICHKYHKLYLWRKNFHVEKFQLSIQNLNNLWSFIEVDAVFVPNATITTLYKVIITRQFVIVNMKDIQLANVSVSGPTNTLPDLHHVHTCIPPPDSCILIQ